MYVHSWRLTERDHAHHTTPQHTQGVHTHAWGLKYLVFAGFLVGMFFVDNSAWRARGCVCVCPDVPVGFGSIHPPLSHSITSSLQTTPTPTEVFNGYVHLARVASLVYLVAQVVTLINFSCACASATATGTDKRLVSALVRGWGLWQAGVRAHRCRLVF